MGKRRLAITKDGDVTYCTASDESIEKGHCNHIRHQKKDEYAHDFVNKYNAINRSLFLAKKLMPDNVFCAMKMEERAGDFADIYTVIAGGHSPNIDADEEDIIKDNVNAWKYLFKNIYIDSTTDLIKDFNRITAAHESLSPGNFRTGETSVTGTDKTPKVWNKKDIVTNFNKIMDIEDPKERATELFCFITHEQVFWDGNKRTGLLAANKELISSNVGVMIIREKDFLTFNRLLLNYYDKDEKQPFKDFLKVHVTQIR